MDKEASSAPLVTAATYIDQTFGKGGFIAQGKADYSPRPGQIAFARAVDDAIVHKRHLIAEAATGVGKSLAYAVPASFRVWEQKQAGKKDVHAILVTANISLQEQVVTKDLPFLQKVLPWTFTYGLLKGRSNYLCLSAYYKRKSEAWTGEQNSFVDRRRLQVIQEWADATVAAGKEEETGDVSELPFEDGLLWSKFSASADECRGQQCRNARACFGLHQQAKAKSSDLIVTNYHMLFADILIRQQTDGGFVLPDSDIVIADEFQNSSSVARSFFGWNLTREALRRAARAVQSEDTQIEQEMENRSRIFFDLMASMRKDFHRYKGFIDKEFFEHETQAGLAMMHVIEKVCSIHTTRAADLYTKAGGRECPISEMSDREAAFAEEALDLERGAQRLRVHLGNLEQFLNPWAQDGTQVFHVECDEKGRTTICSKLIHPREALGPTLFRLSECDDDPFSDLPSKPSPVNTVVMTSATLAIGKNDFSYVAFDMGVPRGYQELVVESPFDWRKQACLIIPDGLSVPGTKEWKDEVVDALKKTIALAGGRTLGLFTSYAMLNFAYDALVSWCRQRNIVLLRQKDAPRTKLIEQFKSDVTSCLFGTESFWAGVDVPGEALSVTFIDKIPFPTRDDPVLGALEKVDKNAFHDYSMPQAIIKLRQGVGRLIRSVNDHGAIVLMDNRILTARYGRRILKSLPPMELKSNLSDLAGWLEKVSHTGALR